MNIRDKLVANSRLKEVEKGIFIVAIRTNKSERYDTVVSDGYGLGGEPIYLLRVSDFNIEIADNDQVFLITNESWERMTNKNLFVKKDK